MLRKELLSKYEEWKIPSLKLEKFDCEWEKDRGNPFPFIMRKSEFIEVGFLLEVIIFKDLENAHHSFCNAYAQERIVGSVMPPHGEWYVVNGGKTEDIKVTTEKILNALRQGYEWIHIEETGVWYTDYYKGEEIEQPCWIKETYSLAREVRKTRKLTKELESRNEAQSPVVGIFGRKYCPNCGTKGAKYNFCQNCGQRLINQIRVVGGNKNEQRT